MRWYKRLFWKIFAAIWLISCIVLLVAVTLIGINAERDRHEEVLIAKAQGYAHWAVAHYENRGQRSFIAPRLPYRGERRNHEKREPRERFFKSKPLPMAKRLQIIDLEKGMPLLIGNRVAAEVSEGHAFTLLSSSGREYRATVDLTPQQSPLAHMLRVVLSLQIVLIMIASALAAVALSALIVRPLNQLRAHAQAIYRGELGRRSDNALRARGDELGELAREFDRMAEYIQNTLNAHQRLLQDVSHELRAPLARLQAAAGLAEQRLGEGDKTVARIMRESEQLNCLIAEILSLSRIEQMESQGEAVDISVLLQRLIEDARFSYPQREFNLVINSHCTVALNQQLLERALNNILGNACKHTPEDKPIDLELSQTSHCVIRIRDYGEGVSAAMLAQLCEPFYRGDSTTQGYGLGLSIVKRAIERLGGELRIANHPQGGLEVILCLPKSPP